MVPSCGGITDSAVRNPVRLMQIADGERIRMNHVPFKLLLFD